MKFPEWTTPYQQKELLKNGKFIEEYSYNNEDGIIIKYLQLSGFSWFAKFDNVEVSEIDNLELLSGDEFNYGNKGMVWAFFGEYRFNGEIYDGVVEKWIHSGDTYGIDKEITLFFNIGFDVY